MIERQHDHNDQDEYEKTMTSLTAARVEMVVRLSNKEIYVYIYIYIYIHTHTCIIVQSNLYFLVPMQKIKKTIQRLSAADSKAPVVSPKTVQSCQEISSGSWSV